MSRAALVAVLAIVGLRADWQSSAAPESIELDAVVVNSNDEVVGGLGQDDFEIKEDGRPVQIVGVSEMTPDSPRSLVVLLENGMLPTATQSVQFIARMLVSRVTAIGSNVPRVGVLRLLHPEEEVFISRDGAMQRIDAYLSGSSEPYSRIDGRVESYLMTTARLAQGLQTSGHSRKTLVGVGRVELFNDAKPIEADPQWAEWVHAVSALAGANVVVNVINPAGINQFPSGASGLVDETGGRVIASNDFRRAVDLIWSEASHYYLIRYQPAERKRELHSIQASVRRRGLHIRTRRSRGN